MDKSEPMKTTDPYQEKFARFGTEGPGVGPAWVVPIRQAGLARFTQLGYPTLQDEDWRFTNVQPIAKLPFKPVFEYTPGALAPEALARYVFANLPGAKLVFVNGHYAPELSSLALAAKEIRIGSLANALAADPLLVEQHLAKISRGDKNPFNALNTAFFQDGAFIHLPPGQATREPIQLLFVSTSAEAGATAHPRNLIVAERNSRLTVVESYVSTVDAAHLTNAVTEFIVGEGAVVEHCKFQDQSRDSYHIASLHCCLSARANFISHSIATGARLSRNNIVTLLDGEGVECVLNGLYLTRGEQLVDHHMVVDHAQPRCASHEYFNGILDGRSKGVFHGRILVRKGAQKTDAKQTNKNLLLSDNATVDTKPQLEIYADDVKCTHGATIGQLDEESVFYLRARGIGLERARRMLIHAFAGEIIDRIRCEPVRSELDRLVWDQLEQNEQVAIKND